MTVFLYVTLVSIGILLLVGALTSQRSASFYGGVMLLLFVLSLPLLDSLQAVS